MLNWRLAILGFWLSLLLALPATPQSLVGNRLDEAAIMLDGRELFQVSRLENPDLSAADRVSQPNKQLAEAVGARELLQVEVRSQPNAVTLRLANQHLLTVTERDRRIGLEATEQAKIWQGKLNQALETAKYERTPAYQRKSLLESAGVFVLVLALHFTVQWMRRRQRFGKQKNAILLGLTVLQLSFWLGGAYAICERFPRLRLAQYEITKTFSQPLFELSSGKAYSLIDLVLFVVIVVGLWVAVRGFTLLLKTRILKMTGAERGVQDAIAILAQYALTLLGLFVILQLAGVDVSSLLILGSALGVGIGFGLQNIVNNFFSGIIILLERPIEVGDFIHVGELVGTVERINARSTEIRTLDQVSIIVPNAHFTEKEVVNWSHGNPVARIHLPVAVAYGSNLATVQMALLEAVKAHPDILAYPQPQINFQGFGESSLDFDILVWLREPREQYRIKSDLYYRIEVSLKQYEIEIPFPQRDLHVRSQQLDQLLALMIQKQQPEQPHLYYPGQDQPQVDPAQQGSTERQPHLQPLQSIPKLSLDLDTLAEQMRSGISIQDRRHRLNLYPRCFVGSDAVAWLMETQKATQQEAIRLGQRLMEKGMIHHVLDEHPFTDAYLFYRFYADESLEKDESPES
ncbi:MAG: mechanosensitive ion channel domain-containing protein [Thermosynechococcaceae cyanobacterium]